MKDQSDSEQFPLIDATDHEIIMHRDAHFGGQFSEMLDYYRQGGKGIQEEFSLERIEQLAKLEESLRQNLAPLFLSGSEAEKIAESRETYKQLRAIYEVQSQKNYYPQLMADLILTEDEEADAEVQAIVAEKGSIVPYLINLLRSEHFYDPLFPGYGLAPTLAVKCLGLIGDKRAIISLFEAVGKSDFFADDQILKALKEIGEPAKEFLLRVVAGHPINEDNERAAIALIQFKDDEQVAEACFELLQDKDVQKDPCLPTYLVLTCAGLKKPLLRKQLADMSQNSAFPRSLREDIKAIIHSWEEKV